MRVTVILSLMTALVSTTGCGWLVNAIAYHPDTKHNIPASALPRGVREVYFRSSDGVRLHGLFLRHPKSDAVVVYFHGNAGNISMRLPLLRTIRAMGISVLGVSYRGYGKSRGSASERGLYKDGAAAMDYVKRLGYPPGRVIIMGRSIGSTVAVHTAQHRSLLGLILVSPLLTGRAQARAGGFGWLSFIAGSSFNNFGKVTNVTCPVLVIHGTKDKVIPYAHGVRLYNRITAKKHFETIPGGGHNNLSIGRFGSRYGAALKAFFQRRHVIP